MLENQFIKFESLTIAQASKKPVLPIKFGRQTIFINNGQTMSAHYPNGEVEQSDQIYVKHIVIFSGEDGGVLDGCDFPYGSIFYLSIEVSGIQYYSQPLLRIPQNAESDFAIIKYRCNEDAFGFPFTTPPGGEYDDKAYAIVYLPIRLHSPQNVQEDKTYVKSNGEVVTLYAKYYREWEGETEFLSAEMHDKIVAALSCDEVYIDGKRVTKSDNYQVDWENYDLDCDGVTKLARATFKVRENTNQRNSNF